MLFTDFGINDMDFRYYFFASFTILDFGDFN